MIETTAPPSPAAPAPSASPSPRMRLLPGGGTAPHEALPVRAVVHRERWYRWTLVLADLVSATVALLLCATVLGDARLSPALLLGLPLVVLASKLQGLYDRDELVVHKTTIDEAPALFQLATLYAFAIWVLDDVVLTHPLGSAQAVALLASLWSFALLFRAAARRFAARHAATERLLGIGDPATCARLAAKLELSGADAAIVATVAMDDVVAQRGDRAHPCERTLRELLRTLDVHRVLIVPSPREDGLTPELVRAVKSTGMRVSLVPRVLDVVGGAVVFDEVAGMTMLGVRRFELSRTSLLVKRAFDLAGALCGLVLLAPFLALTALAIKLDSPGPVLFRQERVGRDGRRFRICKFRTMVADAERRKGELMAFNEADGLFKIKADPRITRVGRLLRQTSLDELPQLLNVVRGEMSLVGPRPLIVSEDEAILGYDRRRLHLTPGMTGHWQIMGSSRVSLAEMVKIDYLYITTWSLFQDLKILVRTALYVVSRQGM